MSEQVAIGERSSTYAPISPRVGPCRPRVSTSNRRLGFFFHPKSLQRQTGDRHFASCRDFSFLSVTRSSSNRFSWNFDRAVFSALTFTAGHLNHEVRDFELFQKPMRALTGRSASGQLHRRADIFTRYLSFSVGWFRFVPPARSHFSRSSFYLLASFLVLRALRRQSIRKCRRFQFQYARSTVIGGSQALLALFTE